MVDIAESRFYRATAQSTLVAQPQGGLHHLIEGIIATVDQGVDVAAPGLALNAVDYLAVVAAGDIVNQYTYDPRAAGRQAAGIQIGNKIELDHYLPQPDPLAWGETLPGSFNTRDTVATDTPASRATSRIVFKSITLHVYEPPL